jgi:4-aminobutyrate aminotransferase
VGDRRHPSVRFLTELRGPGDVPRVQRETGQRIQGEALARKLIVLTAGTYVNVIRIIPPLVTTADEVDRALGILDESLAQLAALAAIP